MGGLIARDCARELSLAQVSCILMYTLCGCMVDGLAWCYGGKLSVIFILALLRYVYLHGSCEDLFQLFVFHLQGKERRHQQLLGCGSGVRVVTQQKTNHLYLEEEKKKEEMQNQYTCKPI